MGGRMEVEEEEEEEEEVGRTVRRGEKNLRLMMGGGKSG